ncbi:MAG: hypothetical protein ACR2HX_14785 [Pyrinomonadaceae bacterium]
MPLIELDVQDLTFPKLPIALQHSEEGFNQKQIARLMMGHANIRHTDRYFTQLILAYRGR